MATVLSYWLSQYDPAFYNKLYSMEQSAYASPYPTYWATEFSNLMGAINTWAAHTHRARSITRTKSLIGAIYMYRYLGSAFGTSMADLYKMEAPKIYDIGGFIPLTMSRPTNYYDDMVVTGVPPDPVEAESAKMTADVASLAPAVFEPIETDKIEEILDLAGTSSSIVTYNALFNDLPAQAAAPTKQQMATIIFTDYKFEIVKQYITGVKGIDIPVYP